MQESDKVFQTYLNLMVDNSPSYFDTSPGALSDEQ